LPPEHTQFFLTQFYNVKWLGKNSLILYLAQKWAEMNGKNCNVEHPKISQNNCKVTSSLGFSSKNLLE